MKHALVRKTVSTVLATLLLSLSVAVPMMDRGELSGTVAAESQHDPGRCGHGHDHRICTQVGANLSLTGSAHDWRLPDVAVRLVRPVNPRLDPRATFLEGPPSRAPPLA